MPYKITSWNGNTEHATTLRGAKQLVREQASKHAGKLIWTRKNYDAVLVHGAKRTDKRWQIETVPQWSEEELRAAQEINPGSTAAVARHLGVTRGVAERALDFYGIPRGHKPRNKRLEIDKETLSEVYERHGCALGAAEEIGVTKSTVLRWLEIYNIPKYRRGGVGLIRIEVLRRWVTMMGRGRDEEVFEEMSALLSEKEEAFVKREKARKGAP